MVKRNYPAQMGTRNTNLGHKVKLFLVLLCFVVQFASCALVHNRHNFSGPRLVAEQRAQQSLLPLLWRPWSVKLEITLQSANE
mgnify:FL=1